MNDAQITIITALKPKTLTKSFHKAPDGALVKTPGGPLVDGIAERLTISGIDALAAVIKDIGTDQALVYGVSEHEKARIVTLSDLPRANAAKAWKTPAIARSRKYFSWATGPGKMLFDFDGFKADTADEIFKILVEIHPALSQAPMIIMPSASSGLYQGETCLKGLDGWRALVLVADASDIPRTGDTLFKLSWLQGRGFIYISRSGAQLPRGPIDNSVWQPERLDFVGGAKCKPPLEQRRPEPVLYNKDAEPMDTRNIKSLSPAETLQYETLIKNEKIITAPEAQESRDAWTDQKIEDECKKLPEDDKERIISRIKRASKHRYLELDYALETLTGEPLTPEGILTRREHWHLKYIKDPFDTGARPRARVFTMTGGKPYIFSYSENKRYYLTITRKTLEISPGNRCNAVDNLIKTARKAGNFFLRGGEVVTVADTGDIKPLDTLALQFRIDGLITFLKFDARAKAFKPADCPKNYADGFSVSARLDGGLPELKGIIEHPTINPKTGRIIDQDGYDAGTGLLLRTNGDDWPTIPDKPNDDEIVKAVAALLDPFFFFPFAGAVDRGVYLAAMLTAVIRGLLEKAPLFMITAPTPGTGKTLLSILTARMIGIKFPSMFPFGGVNEEEIRKRLLSIFRQGERVTILDNITGTLSSDSLCMALTNIDFTDRILGVSNIIKAPTNTLMMATGNNIRPGGDLCRRTVIARLDTGLEKPWTRIFAENIIDRIDRERVKMVTAALTILKGTLESGFTVADGLGSFEDWNTTARAAVCYAAKLGFDVADPAKSIETSLSDDPETGKLRALLSAWFAVFSDAPTSTAACISTANEYDNTDFNSSGGMNRRYPALFDACDEIAGERGTINIRRFSRWIERHRDRVIDGMVFQLSEIRTDGAKHWTVKLKI